MRVIIGILGTKMNDYDTYESRPRTVETIEIWRMTHKVKIETPAFDGAYDPQVFSDWISYMNYYFEWYNMPEEHKVHFARMKLHRSVKTFWTLVERYLETI